MLEHFLNDSIAAVLGKDEMLIYVEFQHVLLITVIESNTVALEIPSEGTIWPSFAQ